MTRKPNFAKCMLGIVVLALLFIGTFAITRAPLTSAKKTDLAATKSSANSPKIALPGARALTPPLFDSIFNVFELEGDIEDNPGGAPDDWVTVNCDGGNSVIKTGVLHDGLGASIFTGGGSKDPELLGSWKWKDGSVPDKDEIINAYAAKFTGTPGGDDILIFGADRFDNSGTAFMGFWFFKDSVVPAADFKFRTGPLATDPLSAHQIGDVLVLIEFSNGGAVATAKVFEWVGSGGSESGGTLNDVTGTAPLGSVFSVSNASPVTIPATGSCPTSWQYTPKGGVAGGPISTNSFFEGGINLNAFPALAGSCFSSFAAETRSSSVVTATLKDFVIGTFNTCVSLTISKTVTDVCEGSGAAGATTYTYKVKNVGGVTANFTLTDDNETNPYSQPFAASQIGADDLDVGKDNNCATQIGAGTPTSFSLGPNVEKTFICTRNRPPGTYTDTAQATGTFQGSTQTKIATATAHVFANPAASAGANQSVCGTAPHIFTLSGATATVPAGGTRTWSVVSGSANISDTSALNPTATLNAFGSATLRLTVKSAATQTPSCPDATSDITLTLSQNPAANAGPNLDACETNASHEFTISGSSATTPIGSQITWTGPLGVSFDDIHALHPKVTVTSFGTVTLTMSVSNTATGSGCLPASATVNLTLNQNPTAAAGPDQTDCSAGVTTPFTLAGSATNGTTVWTCDSGDCAKVSITTPGSLTSGVVFTGTGSATLKLTTTSNATPTSCGTASDTVILTVDPNPTVTICGDESCSVDNILALTANVTPGTGTITYSWTGPAGGISSDPTLQTISVVLPGTYTVAVTRKASAASDACPGMISMHVGLCPGGVCGTP